MGADPKLVRSGLKPFFTGDNMLVFGVAVREDNAPHGVLSFAVTASLDEAVTAAVTLACEYHVYFLPNPVDLEPVAGPTPAVCGDLAKAENVTRLDWLSADVDSVRTPGTAASEEQRHEAQGLARAIRDEQALDHGWPAPILTDSGNGSQVFWKLDSIENTKQTRGIVKQSIRALAARFSTSNVRLDTSRSNVNGLFRVPGTFNHKGGEERTCTVLEAPLPLPPPLRREALEAFAGPPEVERPEPAGPAADPVRVGERATIWAEQFEPCPPEGGGSRNTTFRRACQLLDFDGVSEALAAALVLAWLQRSGMPGVGQDGEPLETWARDMVRQAHAYIQAHGGATRAFREPVDPLDGLDLDGIPSGGNGKGNGVPPRNRGSHYIVEDYDEFRERVAAMKEKSWLMRERVLAEGTMVDFGKQRAFKTWDLLVTGMSLASGRAGYDHDRFDCPEAVPVTYISQEDPERPTERRFALLEAGLGLHPPRDMFFPVIRKNIDLDNEDCRADLLEDIKATRTRVGVFEPMRALTALAEGTATDFKPILDWFRRVQDETEMRTLIFGAHVTKIVVGDTREKVDQMMGGALRTVGDIFSHFQKQQDGTSSLVQPLEYKFGCTPSPFLMRLDSDSIPGMEDDATYVRLTVETTDAEKEQEKETNKRILDFLIKCAAKHPTEPLLRFASQDQIKKGASVDSNQLKARLRDLQENKRIVPGGAEERRALKTAPNAILWGICQ
jgi:hypothetical protein